MNESSEGCQLCEPAPHENCEVWSQLVVVDPVTGDRSAVDVCLEHYEAMEGVLSND